MSSFGIDLPSIIQAAQQTRRSQLERQAMERQASHDAQMQDAVRGYNAGSKGQLAEIDPQMYQQLEKGAADLALRRAQTSGEQSQLQAGQQKAALDLHRNTARAMALAAKLVKANPGRWPQVRQGLMQQAQQGMISQLDLPEQLTPELMQQVDQLSQMDLAVLDPQKAEEQPIDEVAKRVMLGKGLRPGTPEFQRAYQSELAQARHDELAKQAPKVTAGGLRQEFQTQQVYKDMQTVASAYEKVKSTSDTGAGDISLIFAYMKLLDPNSTVREGEFATAQNAGSVPDSLVAQYNKAINGQRLAPEVRQQFRTEAGHVFGAQKQRYDAVAKQYGRLAEQAGIPQQDVVLDPGFAAAAAPAGGAHAPGAPSRTDPATGETRVWDGQAWVKP